jgi:hypothetical protein
MGKRKTETEKLVEELISLLPQLDTEGLSFLIEQAQVHLYNMKVDEINRAETAAAKSASGTGKARAKSTPSSRTHGEIFRIEGSESGSSYYVIYKNEWIMFSKDEMFTLVKIVNGDGTDLEIRERLFSWLERERSDMLSAAFIKTKFDDKLKILSALVKKTFKIRKS